jgi:hypothetical protein
MGGALRVVRTCRRWLISRVEQVACIGPYARVVSESEFGGGEVNEPSGRTEQPFPPEQPFPRPATFAASAGEHRAGAADRSDPELRGSWWAWSFASADPDADTRTIATVLSDGTDHVGSRWERLSDGPESFSWLVRMKVPTLYIRVRSTHRYRVDVIPRFDGPHTFGLRLVLADRARYLEKPTVHGLSFATDILNERLNALLPLLPHP